MLYLGVLNFGYAQNEDINLLRRQLANAKNESDKFDNLRHISIYYHQNGVSDSLNLSTKKLLDIAQQLKNDSLLCVAYSWIGIYFDDTGDYAHALEFNFKSLKLAEAIDDKERIGLLYNNISWIYIEMGNYSNGVTYSKKAVQVLAGIKEHLSYKIGLPISYDNVAQAYLGLKNADSALNYTQLENTANLKLGNHFVQTYILCEFARTYEMLNDPAMAESYYRRTISYGDSLHTLQPLSQAAAQYSNFLYNQKRYVEAKDNALIGLRAAKEGGYKRQVIDNAERLRTIYDTLNNKDSSYYYAKMVIAYRDTVFNEQKNIQVQNLMFTQQIHEKESEEEKINASHKRANDLQYAAIAVGLLLFIIIFLLLSGSIIINEKWISFLGVLVLLIAFEFINLLFHPFLENITNHSPALMLLGLVAIAALLIPLHIRMEHLVKHKMVEKNKRLRLAAAKKTVEKLEQKAGNE